MNLNNYHNNYEIFCLQTMSIIEVLFNNSLLISFEVSNNRTHYKFILKMIGCLLRCDAIYRSFIVNSIIKVYKAIS